MHRMFKVSLEQQIIHTAHDPVKRVLASLSNHYHPYSTRPISRGSWPVLATTSSKFRSGLLSLNSMSIMNASSNPMIITSYN